VDTNERGLVHVCPGACLAKLIVARLHLMMWLVAIVMQGAWEYYRRPIIQLVVGALMTFIVVCMVTKGQPTQFFASWNKLPANTPSADTPSVNLEVVNQESIMRHLLMKYNFCEQGHCVLEWQRRTRTWRTLGAVVRLELWASKITGVYSLLFVPVLLTVYVFGANFFECGQLHLRPTITYAPRLLSADRILC
jgi:hypothetical protein